VPCSAYFVCVELGASILGLVRRGYGGGLAWAPEQDASGVTLILEYLSACSEVLRDVEGLLWV
jgi:hypothetical protein